MHDPAYINKGFLQSLLDTDFDHPITIRMVRAVYRLSLTMASLFAFLLAWYGLAFLEWSTSLGIMILASTPVIWFFQVTMTRLFLEFLVNQFKITECLQVLKAQGQRRR